MILIHLKPVLIKENTVQIWNRKLNSSLSFLLTGLYILHAGLLLWSPLKQIRPPKARRSHSQSSEVLEVHPPSNFLILKYQYLRVSQWCYLDYTPNFWQMPLKKEKPLFVWSWPLFSRMWSLDSWRTSPGASIYEWFHKGKDVAPPLRWGWDEENSLISSLL